MASPKDEVAILRAELESLPPQTYYRDVGTIPNPQMDDNLYSSSKSGEIGVRAAEITLEAADDVFFSAQQEADRAKNEADTARDIVSAFSGEIDLPPRTIPSAPFVANSSLSGAEFSEYAFNAGGLDALPVLSWDFANSGELGRGIDFTRLSADWGWTEKGEYRKFGVNRPVVERGKGLWVSGARTNLALWSEDLTNPSWIRARMSVDFDPTSGFFKMETTDQGRSTYIRQDVTLPAGSSITIQIEILKTGSQNYIGFVGQGSGEGAPLATLAINPDDLQLTYNDGVNGADYGIEDKGDHVLAWLSVPYNLTNDRVISAQIGNWVKDLGEKTLVKNPQIESGSFATTYIPTNGSQVTVANTSAELENLLQKDCRTVMFSVVGSAISRTQPNGFLLVLSGGSSIRVQAYLGGPVRLVVGNSTGVTLNHGDPYELKGSFLLSWDGRHIHAYSEGVKLGAIESDRGFNFLELPPTRWIVNWGYITFFQEYMTETQVAALYR